MVRKENVRGTGRLVINQDGTIISNNQRRNKKAPKHGWAVVTIRDEIHAKIREMIQNPHWDELGTISAFVENAVIKEIKRVGKQRRKLGKEEGEETLGK